MGFIKTVEKILGIRPIEIGELNRRSTLEVKRLRSKELPKEDLDGIITTSEYKLVVELLKGGVPIVFVTGNAGTGKSTLIRYLRNVLDKRLVVVAPTGVAALNVNGVTIHSFFQFPPKIHEEEDIKFLYDRKLYEKLELLIIDEVSMVRGDIMDSIDKFLRKNRSNNSPFGGVQILLIGDLFQLPPVVPNHEWDVLKLKGYASPYFFSSFSLQKTSLVPLELNSVYRQEDPSFVDLLNQIRIGENLEFVTSEVNRRCSQRKDLNVDITLTCTNMRADQINQQELKNLVTKEYSFKGKIVGKFSLGHDKLPSPFDLRLKKGAHVMFTQNSSLWVNGTIGIVRDIDPQMIRVEIVNNGMVCDVGLATWESYRYSYDSGKDRIVAIKVGHYTQYPLMLAWAITIHKSQGKSLDKVMVDFGSGAFAFGQVYVALSRCRSIEGISLLSPIQKTDVKCDPIIKRFYSTLEQELA
jgi:ATP-dependent DNA helicase PIF1